jgi:NAD(P)-dependent dehydrogenase (short-subunit alcohol dehydrogenase family)
MERFMKSILITGAASGIGAATVRKLATKNISFTLTTKSNEEDLELIAQYARRKGASVNTLCGDLSNKNFLETLINLARNETGIIDQFVANAGYANKQKFGEFSDEEINQSIQTMAISFSSIINLCLEDFKKSNNARIITISSFVNKTIGLNDNIFPTTAAAKGALEALTKTLAYQLAKYDVTVNSISPGYTKKDGTHSALSPEEWKKIISKIPLSRLAKPNDIANMISFLLSKQASYITGQIIKVDGGLSLI